MNDRELKIERIVEAPAELIWKCWTTPELMMPWFCPKPWETIDARCDLKVGGEFYSLMKSPEGQEFPNYGVYLELVKNKRIVWTDAFLPGWIPVEDSSDRPFLLVASLDFEDLGGGKTKYTAIARHWTVDACQKHKEMGFYEGWGTCIDQLVEYIKGMK